MSVNTPASAVVIVGLVAVIVVDLAKGAGDRTGADVHGDQVLVVLDSEFVDIKELAITATAIPRVG